MEGSADCEACEVLYDGDPPCHECPQPKLLPENLAAWKIWGICNSHERPFDGYGGAILPIKATSAAQLVAAYGESLITFEKVIYLDKMLRPWIAEKAKMAGKEDPANPMTHPRDT